MAHIGSSGDATGTQLTATANADVEEAATAKPPDLTSLDGDGHEGEESFIQSLRINQSGLSRHSEHHRFTQLERLYSKSRKKKKLAIGSNFVIDKLSTRRGYTRIASVYLQNIYNKFFVPVWCAAFDDASHTGYVLYPKLTLVKKMLYEMRDRRSEEDMNHAIRLCIPPVALAVDALHTPVLNRRLTYYHRDICIDNVFVSKTSAKNSRDNDVVVYGEAMLKMSKRTRGSREVEEESIDQELSVKRRRVKRKYFNHPEPYMDMSSVQYKYSKRHDWFSVGVYMLEVLGIALHEELVTSDVPDDAEKRIKYYVDFAKRLATAIDQKTFSKQSTSKTFRKYITIALKYIENEMPSNEQIMTYTIRGTASEPETEYFFEYGLLEETAELLGIFDNVRELDRSYKSLQHTLNQRVDKEKEIIAAKKQDDKTAVRQIIPEKVDICQACLLRPSVPFKMRAYRGGTYRRESTTVRNQCGDRCNRFYCAQCYMNGERLFCPMQHGTASTVIGHHSSFALILYGEHFEEPEKDLFQKEANGLSNILTHKMIIGLHKDNVLVKSVFSKQCLQDVCDKIRNMIRGKQLLGADRRDEKECKIDTDYCLFIFYSGHGKHKDDTQSLDGTWNTTGKPDGMIGPEDVNTCIDSISKCENKDCSCSKSRMEVMYVMAHCYPSAPADGPDCARAGRHNLSAVSSLTPLYETKEIIHPKHGSDIVHWLCTLLLSVFAHECRKKYKSSGDCHTCIEMKKHIAENCFNVFIDGECLTYHARHMKDDPDYKTVIDVRAKPEVVLARYHPDGIRYRLFPYNHGHGPLDIDFKLLMDYAKVWCEIHRMVKERNTEAKGICLLTSNEREDSKYGLVWAGDLQNKLESTSETSPSHVFYHIVTDRVKVILASGTEEVPLELFLDVKDISSGAVVVDPPSRELSSTENLESASTRLPNLLVYIVHHLYHKTPTNDTDENEIQAPVPGSNVQVTESGVSPEERIRNGFAQELFHDSREVQLEIMKEADWRKLEEDASQYWLTDRKKGLKVDSTEFDCDTLQPIRISWSESQEGGNEANVEFATS